MAVTIQTRRDDSVDWTTANPVLALGEIGIETDTNKAKYGDGFTAWNDLDYWIIPDVDKPVEPGTANGQTLRWNLTEAGWEATSDLVVDDAGNVGIGTDSPTKTLDVNGEVRGVSNFIVDQPSGSGQSNYAMHQAGSRVAQLYATTGVMQLSAEGAGMHMRLRAQDPAGYIRFDTGGSSERMRIDSSGNLLVGGTALDPALNNAYHSQISSGGQLQLSTNLGAALTTNRQAVGGSHWQLYSGGSGNPSGGVTTDGTTPSFFNNSDESLKENIVDMAPQLANVMALRPRNFDMKETGINHDGFIAQEVVKVWPDRVRVDEDSEILQLMDLSKTDARIIKAIQEQQSMITELTTRLEALEA